MNRGQTPIDSSLSRWKTAKNIGKIRRTVLPWSLILLWLVIVILPFLLSGNGLRIKAESIDWLNDDWRTSSDTIVTLPAHIGGSSNTVLSISRRLPEDFTKEQTVCLRSSLQSLTVRLDGQEIYHYDTTAGSQGRRPPTTAWHILRLPKNSDDSLLELELASPYENMAGYINPVFYGRKAAILYYLAEQYGLGLLTTFLIFLTGIIMLLMALLLRDIKDNSLVYIGFFSLFTSIWLFCESRLPQFFIGNTFFLGSAAFLALTAIPIPLLLYIHENITSHWKKVYRLLCFWFLFLFAANLLLQLTGIADFYELLWITHISLLMTAVFMAGSLTFEYKYYDNPEVLPFAKSIFLMVAFFIAELIAFYFGDFYPTSTFIRIGIVLFIVSLGIHTLKRLRKAIDNSRKASIMEKLAYIDILTGALNRTAYDRDLEGLDPEAEKVVIAILDVNDLKIINDRYGHSAGDETIRLAYKCINEAYGDYGSCYRIGGDEFACIIRGESVDDFPQRLELFRRLVEETSAETEYQFGVAIGYAHSEYENHQDIMSFLSHADAMMYT
ncbi:MAG: GGDEF domain-containing protein, partial [Clostridiaceae bacterium]|nr:GGDEF domain-containing protein [Clostridiaceae bacterium]